MKEYLKSLFFTKQNNIKTPVFVLGCQRSGTTMLLNIIQQSPECYVYHEGNKKAYDNFRIKPDNIIKRLLEKNKVKVSVFKPLNDLQYAERFLQLHDNAKIIWIYRNYCDVVNSSVKKWGDAQKNIMLAISKGDNKYPEQKVVEEGMTTETVELIKSICNDENISAEDGAALMWYVRNLVYFDLNLDTNNRVVLEKYENLVIKPEQHFQRIFDFLGCSFSKKYLDNVYNSSIGKASSVKTGSIDDLCKKLMDKLNKQYA